MFEQQKQTFGKVKFKDGIISYNIIKTIRNILRYNIMEGGIGIA